MVVTTAVYNVEYSEMVPSEFSYSIEITLPPALKSEGLSPMSSLILVLHPSRLLLYQVPNQQGDGVPAATKRGFDPSQSKCDCIYKKKKKCLTVASSLKTGSHPVETRKTWYDLSRIKVRPTHTGITKASKAAHALHIVKRVAKEIIGVQKGK